MTSPEQAKPIRSQFSGGTDFDNDITITGMTFDEAMEVVELLGRLVRARRSVPSPSPLAAEGKSEGEP